ncbi:MAG: type II toxin-antitoxin system RelE/ParE family toxin [Bifidobacteriaceae bacterium]|nr:type II toxin-antitoxin system RelE/ParE family toxin [Bifidobacteriaceae bacterium]
MYKIKTTDEFDTWQNNIRDYRTYARVNAKITMIGKGNLGDYKNVGEKIFETRIHTGKGIRLYFTKKQKEIILLLIGGDKSSQKKDIEKAKQLAKEY